MEELKIKRNPIKITVITVVYNDRDGLQNTADSVIRQDYDNIEYIIKDGGSTDGTLEVIRNYAETYDNIRYSSGKDAGIYDAMNEAMEMASGDVIEFLNAGDRFVSDNVVSRAMETIMETGSDIVYGDVIYENMDGTVNVRTYPQSCSRKIYYLTGDVINHQCLFARKKLFENNRFDTDYRICADREWMMRIGAYSPNLKMISMGFPVVIYPLDGFSVVNKGLYKKETDRCVRKHMPLGYPVYAVFEFMRSHKALADLLHMLYKKIYYKK